MSRTTHSTRLCKSLPFESNARQNNSIRLSRAPAKIKVMHASHGNRHQQKGPKSLPHSVGKGAHGHGGSTHAGIGQFVVTAALTGPWSWGKRADVGAAGFQKDRRFTIYRCVIVIATVGSSDHQLFTYNTWPGPREKGSIPLKVLTSHLFSAKVRICWSLCSGSWFFIPPPQESYTGLELWTGIITTQLLWA